MFRLLLLAIGYFVLGSIVVIGALTADGWWRSLAVFFALISFMLLIEWVIKRRRQGRFPLS